MLVHIPLSKISSLFSFLTALVPLSLDKKNKLAIYMSAHDIVSFEELDILSKRNEIAKRFTQKRFQFFKD